MINDEYVKEELFRTNRKEMKGGKLHVSYGKNQTESVI